MNNPWMIGEVEPYRVGTFNVVVKDNLDVQGLPTTCGSRLVASTALPAEEDSSVVARLRATGAHVRGKANLVEFAFGVHGINPWFGTPTNPCSSDLIPGGSSSGSAVAVAVGAAEVGIGTDTGGSIRIPAACCGVLGLKPTYGLIDETGCAPLAPSLDTIGVLSRTIGDLEQGFVGIGGILEGSAPAWIGQLPSGVTAFDAVVTEVLASIDLPIRPMPEVEIDHLWEDGNTVLLSEAYRQLSGYLSQAHRLDPRGLERLRGAMRISESHYLDALQRREGQRERFFRLLGMGEGILVLPTMARAVPYRSSLDVSQVNRLTLPFNYLGCPALTLPVDVGALGLQGHGSGGTVPFALQLVAVDHRESQLLEAARCIDERFSRR
ncbi:amidase [Ferrimicrobium sp.]|uniref:amidase n=1 Tax=Ferrimicrobium sp. TaxID=2926050 RepID=UPI0026095DC4|nr:amidase [Ferrimicrobium sp.]